MVVNFTCIMIVIGAKKNRFNAMFLIFITYTATQISIDNKHFMC